MPGEKFEIGFQDSERQAPLIQDFDIQRGVAYLQNYLSVNDFFCRLISEDIGHFHVLRSDSQRIVRRRLILPAEEVASFPNHIEMVVFLSLDIEQIDILLLD
jgi:hypothetical protein